LISQHLRKIFSEWTVNILIALLAIGLVLSIVASAFLQIQNANNTKTILSTQQQNKETLAQNKALQEDIVTLLNQHSATFANQNVLFIYIEDVLAQICINDHLDCPAPPILKPTS